MVMESFKNGDIIICINDDKTSQLTMYKKYEILNIHDSSIGILIQLLNDYNEIYSFRVPRFMHISEYRNKQITELI